MADISTDQAQSIIDSGISEAEQLISEPSKLDGILQEFQSSVSQLPSTVVGALTQIPTMVDMIKSYVTKEYGEVSPKVIATSVSAILYLVKRKDLIPDNVPILGLADDLAVITLALKLNEPELKAFREWKDAHGTSTEL
ncbi:MAG: DUF1232 domain-containing protein [Atopobiaceae bacterium]|nr:DUF1232 domain-containing protein [Atopobiaceae bacterium]